MSEANEKRRVSGGGILFCSPADGTGSGVAVSLNSEERDWKT